jgi:hypothetical protein
VLEHTRQEGVKALDSTRKPLIDPLLAAETAIHPHQHSRQRPQNLFMLLESFVVGHAASSSSVSSPRPGKQSALHPNVSVNWSSPDYS